ncbi:putative P-loop containing nucleoside triphosphate hydrolase [Helianthus annuus]|nr:putative P-loop containing nucleoside triphosphate hydrolase [Helianthus annuus]KAJ0632585.1 putative P-loop containing nucleoside triphosphate hydrolase [Helianthus annuus]KAJ0826495.1 putative P-loop containing nucleoside triphosphate hydrolase [Helianthus annuus]
MPQLQLLYQELGSMIQTLFSEKRNYLHKLEEVRYLKGRFKDVVEEAHDMLDLIVLHTHSNSKNRIFIQMLHIIDFHPRTDKRKNQSVCAMTVDVMRSIKSIKEEYFSILHNMKMEPHLRTDKPKAQSAAAGATSSSRNSLGANSLLDEIIVGLDREVDLIRDKLAEDTSKLDIVSIVGMGGLGKTTLATKVFTDSFVCYHFRIRGWVTVSQTYEKTYLLNQLLVSIGVKINLDKRHLYSHLREKLHKSLMCQRYLVVIDDIWNTEAWDDLKVVFPNHNNGSRLLLTSRHKKVALHANPYGFIHHLRCLTDEESWELLHKKVFHGHDFPDSLTGPGMQIARNCRGLPLAMVVIAGVLAKEPVIKESWERISQSGSSLIFKGHMETLALSLNHLPSHLRNCFLYLGGFPEDYRFHVARLIWLWIAEGFIQEFENQSLEETAKDYLMELVVRNLVGVQDRKFDRAIKTFFVHDV